MAMTVFCPFEKEHGPCTRQVQCAGKLMCWYYQEMLRNAEKAHEFAQTDWDKPSMNDCGEGK